MQIETQEHDSLTTRARKLYAEHLKACSVVSATDPRGKGFTLLAVGKAGAFRSLYLADKVTDAKAALNDVTKTLQDLGV